MLNLKKIISELNIGDPEDLFADDYERFQVEDFNVYVLQPPWTHPTLNMKVAISNFTEHKMQKMFDGLKYIQDGLRKAGMPPEWKKLNMYLEPFGAEESFYGSKNRMKGKDPADIYAMYFPQSDVIAVNTIADQNIFNYKKFVATVAHEIGHRIYAKRYDTKKTHDRLRRITDQFEDTDHATKWFGFDTDYGIVSSGEFPDEFFCELVAHMVLYPTDEKYKIWKKALNYITGKK